MFHFSAAVHALVFCKDVHAFRQHQHETAAQPNDCAILSGKSSADGSAEDGGSSDDSELTPAQERQARLDQLSQLAIKSRNKAYRQRTIGAVNMPREGVRSRG
jgi:hypothetical protein